MSTKDVQLIVFDIKNCQEDYSICLEFIKTYGNPNISISEKVNRLSEIIERYNIVARDFDGEAALRWIEEPIQKRGQSIQQSREVFEQRIYNSVKLDQNALCSLLKSKKELHYHLRVHMEFEEQEIQMGNLVHFQYLALLLERLFHMGYFRKKLKREMSVF